MRKMKLKAKEHIDNGNKKSAQTICREMVDKEKKISNIVTRKHLLENQITQLEYNEMNKNTITLIEEANQIYEQTMIDPNKMDELVEKNMEIEHKNREINDRMEEMNQRDEEEEGVDELMKELEREVRPKPERIGVHAEVRMEVEKKEV